MKNPVILAGHSHRLGDGRSRVVGSVVGYKFQGKDFVITVQFADTELGREYWELYKNKHQRAFSMGFGRRNSKREDRAPKWCFADKSAANVLEGLTIVVTGTLKNLTRQQIEQMIKDHGGKTASSVSKKTALLVAGENAGSKLEKAQKLGLEVIDESELQRRIS